MSRKFIFDVDGTLTPSREVIDPVFKDWFTSFVKQHDVYLVTGSDYPKTIEQLGEKICLSVMRVYNCSGNDVWEHGRNLFTNDWKLEGFAHEWLAERLCESDFKLRTGQHFEHRPGMCNFSIIGRGANREQRAEYVKYDSATHERERIASAFNTLFPAITAKVGGETGIDIFPTGRDKGQIIHNFDSSDELYFFGDRCDPAGNDYPLAKLIKNTYHVSGWEETFKILKDFTS